MLHARYSSALPFVTALVFLRFNLRLRTVALEIDLCGKLGFQGIGEDELLSN